MTLDLDSMLPDKLRDHIGLPDSVGLLLRELPPLADLKSPHLAHEHKMWEAGGLFYRRHGRFSEALAIYSKLYDHLLAAQDATGIRYPKGTPLVWMSECYAAMGCTATSQRYLMLTLVEDAIEDHGEVSSTQRGSYWRLVWRGLLSDAELNRHAARFINCTRLLPGKCCIRSGSCSSWIDSG
jgi:hypothetical protein